MCTHNVCFEQKYQKYQSFSTANFKFYMCLHGHIFVMVIEVCVPNENSSVFKKIKDGINTFITYSSLKACHIQNHGSSFCT